MVYAAEGIMGTLGQLACTLNIYGTLLVPGTGIPFANTAGIATRIEYTPENVQVPDFSSSNNAPDGVNVLSWEPIAVQ
jgi:hypothetical protein